MNSILNKYQLLLRELYKSEKTLFVILLFITVGSYGLTLVDYSLSKDAAFSTPEYPAQGDGQLIGWLRMGRWGMALFVLILKPFVFLPFFNNLIGISLLFIATLAWVVLFKAVSKQKIMTSSLVIFSTIFISYPLINELYIYAGGSFTLGMGYLLTCLSLILSHELIKNNARNRVWMLSVVLLSIAIAMYESMAVVYLSGFLSVFLLYYIYDHESNWSVRNYIGATSRCGLILLTSVIFKVILSSLIIKILNLPPSGAANHVAWLDPDVSYFLALKKLVGGSAYYYVYNALFYLPVRSFVVSCLIFVGIAIILCRKYKTILPGALIAGMVFSNFALAVIQGAATPYRAAQAMALLVASSWLLLHELLVSHKKQLMRWCQLVICLLVYFQMRDLNLWFYNDHRRFEMDKINFIQCAQMIERECGKGCKKPVAFVGVPAKYPKLRNDSIHPWLKQFPKIRNISQTNGTSVFGVTPRDKEFFLFMEVYGYCFVPASNDLLREAEEDVIRYHIPEYPKNGCAREFDHVVVVNLGSAETAKTP